MANVRTYVKLKCRVCQANDKSDPNARPGLEKGKQKFDIHNCRTDVISEEEWAWRYATAVAVLCQGVGYPGDEEPSSYSYYGGGGGIGEEFL